MLQRTFETKSGFTFHLQPISPMIHQILEIKWQKSKPKPPVVVVYIDDRPRNEYNFDDPVYQDELNIWSMEKTEDTMTTIFSLGITDAVPEDQATLYRRKFSDLDDDKLKYLWVTSKVDIDEELNDLAEAVLGQTMPTEKGLEQSKEQFQSVD